MQTQIETHPENPVEPSLPAEHQFTVEDAGDEVQGAPGALSGQDAPRELTDQNPPGDLNNQVPPGDLIYHDEDFEMYDATAIIKCELGPDFLDPTDSTHVIIVRTATNRTICIDGYKMVKDAISNNQKQVRCYTYSISTDDNEEIAIRKTAIRMLPKAGKCRYAELIRNVKFLFDMLYASRKNPQIFQHGGVRKGEKFNGNKEEDIRTILAKRLGKSRNTISDYLNYGEHLNENVFQYLINNKAKKDFFEKVQSNKRIKVKILKGRNLEDDAITEVISADMFNWWLEYKNNKGKISSITAPPAPPSTGSENLDDDEPLEEFSCRQPPAETNPDENISEISIDEIHRQMEEMAESWDSFAKGKPTPDEISPFLRVLMLDITRISRLTNELIQNQQDDS